ncbi:hypothetical protein [Pseudokordiimonas caeni]|uniref:hypothetical protein n=1 Tax=Pseudokordiimonas caeni TaxID=2997908 RepID=UPI002811DF70|nr:hypothetical protein [Pseudokordiimonas caeni]
MASLTAFSSMRRWMSGEDTETDTENVAVGDRFCLRERLSSVWVVSRISNVESSRYPLVNLRHESYPDLEKTVSVGALADGIDFLPMPRH